MEHETSHCIVLTTVGTAEQAGELAHKILGARLAACIQVQHIQSYYTWQGESCESPESLLMIKTRSALYPALAEFIRTHHSYQTPEIVQLPITAGFPAYLAWIDDATGG